MRIAKSKQTSIIESSGRGVQQYAESDFFYASFPKTILRYSITSRHQNYSTKLKKSPIVSRPYIFYANMKIDGIERWY